MGEVELMPEARDYKWQEIGARIKQARVKSGLTQAGLAGLLGVTPHTVWYWEAGRSKPAHERLVNLAACCDVTTDWLLGRDIVEAEVLDEADVSFRDAIAGLPLEDLESIREFIRFVRHRRLGGGRREG